MGPFRPHIDKVLNCLGRCIDAELLLRHADEVANFAPHWSAALRLEFFQETAVAYGCRQGTHFPLKVPELAKAPAIWISAVRVNTENGSRPERAAMLLLIKLCRNLRRLLLDDLEQCPEFAELLN